jgi:HEAT repeat protein
MLPFIRRIAKRDASCDRARFAPRTGVVLKTIIGSVLAIVVIVVFVVVCRSSGDTIPPIPPNISPELQSLIKGTLSKDAGERMAAVHGLDRLGDGAVPAIPFLIRLLGDQSSVDCCTLNRAAYSVLKALGDPAIRPLIAYLSHSSSASQRENIAMLLGLSRDRHVVEPLVSLLGDRDPDVRKQAAFALRLTHDGRSIDPLLARLQDSAGKVRGAAAWTLGYIGDRRVVEPLIELIGDRNPDVQEFATDALAKIPDSRSLQPLLAQLKNSRSELRASAASALGRLKDVRAVEPLLEVLQHDSDRHAQSLAARALGEIGDSRAVEPLIAVLQDDNPDNSHFRIGATIALKNLRDSRAVDVLLTKAKASGTLAYRQDRFAAIHALGSLSDGRVADFLATIWQDTKELRDARCLAAISLGQTRDPRAAAALAFVLKNGPQPLILQAIECLGERKDPEAKDLLEALLKHELKAVRMAAAIAIKKLELAEELDVEECISADPFM